MQTFKTQNEHALEANGLDAFLRIDDVERVIGMKRSFIYRRIAAGSFPRPFKLSSTASAWRASEVRAWMDAQPRALS